MTYEEVQKNRQKTLKKLRSMLAMAYSGLTEIEYNSLSVAEELIHSKYMLAKKDKERFDKMRRSNND